MLTWVKKKIFNSKSHDAPSEGSADPRFSRMVTCHSLYSPLNRAVPNEDKCRCPTDVNKLVAGLDRIMLPKYFIDLLRKYSKLSVHELNDEITRMGAESIDNSGCKNRMLIQLRETFLMENVLINDDEETAAPTTRTLQTCRCLYAPLANDCRCPTDPNDLIFGLDLMLPRSAIHKLRRFCDMNVYQLMEQAYSYERDFIGSGCKNLLLLFLRDKLLEGKGKPGLMSSEEFAMVREGIANDNFEGVVLTSEHDAHETVRLSEPEEPIVDVFEIQTLPTCDYSYTDLQVKGDECKCVTDPTVFLAGLDSMLPCVSIELLRDSCQMNIFQVIEQIIIFGVGGTPINGCKNKMLLQLREIFLSQNNILELNTSLIPSTKYRIAKGGNATFTPSAPPDSDPLTSVMESLTGMSEDQKQMLQSLLAADSEKDNDGTQLDCCICLDQKRSMVFVPCGHVACCHRCADQLSNCPVCRTKIDMKLNVHYA
ncbi:uncharacterized protein LOC135933987 [Cloeon dipterum]|uniref:uncharacterized protein LOC135933987 n=1 Tax=Cloeon dipterum TaxID=197152 RepID=UPI0032200973